MPSSAFCWRRGPWRSTAQSLGTRSSSGMINNTSLPIAIFKVQVGEASMADRYAYIPLIGIFVMIAWSLDDWAEARKIRSFPSAPGCVCFGYAELCNLPPDELLGERLRSVVAHTGDWRRFVRA